MDPTPHGTVPRNHSFSHPRPHLRFAPRIGRTAATQGGSLRTKYAAILRKEQLNFYTTRTGANTSEHGAGGGSGIRTHVTVSRKHAFQACAFSHSATPPDRGLIAGHILPSLD